MPVHIHQLATEVPEAHYTQEWASELMQGGMALRPAVRRMIRTLYRNSGIEKRHSVVNDLSADHTTSLFFAPDGSRLPTPSTRDRNEVYTREAKILFERTGRSLLERAEGFAASDITHVITVSCTGFFAPGPDFHLVRTLGLPEDTPRFHLGFMGCYAAFQALRMAHAFCRSQPDAVVMVVAVELCTLHLQFSPETDDLIAGAVFADGAAGALVSARSPRGPALELESFHSALAPEGEADMAWTIGDEGFRMRLSTYVPQIIQSNLHPVLEPTLRTMGLSPGDIPWWAIHPGGRAILDRVENSLSLTAAQLAPSRAVLRRFGNMSSATILFVLWELMVGEAVRLEASQRVLAMAFGPGLTVETALLRVTIPDGPPP